jgi:hypothetical protein
LLKAGEWQHRFSDDPALIISEFLWLIVDVFELSDELENNLGLQYDTYVRGEKRLKTLGDNEALLLNKIITTENGEVWPLTITDLKLLH